MIEHSSILDSLLLLTDSDESDHLEKVRRGRAVLSEGFDDVLGEAEADDGQLRRLDDHGGHPAEHVGGERAERDGEVGVLRAGRRDHRAQFGVGQGACGK